MKFTTRVMIPVVAFTFVAGVSSLAAQEPAPAPVQPQAQEQQAVRTAEGELLRVDMDNKVFAIRSSANNQEQQFKFTDGTEIAGEGRNIQGLSAMTGATVSVEFEAEGETAVATRINVESAAADQPAADRPSERVAPEQAAPAPAPAPEQSTPESSTPAPVQQ
jgi:hypothetical protein